jgi:two-component system response regulator VicR
VSAPILALSPSEEDGQNTIDAGADEFIKKPFAMRELLVRVRVNTWHLESPSVGRAGASRRQILGRIVIDPDEVVVLKDGEILDLSQREFDLISFLAEEPGKVFTREEILRQVWDYSSYLGDVRAVDVSIRRLREKIEDDPANPTIIVTRRGRGYVFATS